MGVILLLLTTNYKNPPFDLMFKWKSVINFANFSFWYCCDSRKLIYEFIDWIKIEKFINWFPEKRRNYTLTSMSPYLSLVPTFSIQSWSATIFTSLETFLKMGTYERLECRRKYTDVIRRRKSWTMLKRKIKNFSCFLNIFFHFMSWLIQKKKK